MNIAIVGAGAMGGMLAARLATGPHSHSLTLIDASAVVVEHVNRHGLTVNMPNAVQDVFRIRATANPQEAGLQDVVFFFVKAHHTASAARSAAPLAGPDTIVVSLQNGWGNADVLAEAYAPERIVIGVTYHSATTVGPGKVAHTGIGPTCVGPYVDGAGIGLAARIGQLLNEGGLETTVTETIKTEIWKKLILNASTLPTSALTGLPAGLVGEPGPLRGLVDELAAESVRVARAIGYAIDLEERLDRIHTVLRNAGKGKASMLQDAEAKRKTEIEVVNGAVVREGERHGVAVPLNRAMVSLIAGLERSWRT